MQNPNTSWPRILLRIIGSCRQAQEGYRIASREAHDSDLRYLFSSYALQRSRFSTELEPLVVEMAPPPTMEGEVIESPWFDLDTMLTWRGDGRILERCLQGEKRALDVYFEAVEIIAEPAAARIVQAQLQDVEAAVRRLRELHHLSKAG